MGTDDTTPRIKAGITSQVAFLAIAGCLGLASFTVVTPLLTNKACFVCRQLSASGVPLVDWIPLIGVIFYGFLLIAHLNGRLLRIALLMLPFALFVHLGLFTVMIRQGAFCFTCVGTALLCSVALISAWVAYPTTIISRLWQCTTAGLLAVALTVTVFVVAVDAEALSDEQETVLVLVLQERTTEAPDALHVLLFNVGECPGCQASFRSSVADCIGVPTEKIVVSWLNDDAFIERPTTVVASHQRAVFRNVPSCRQLRELNSHLKNR